MYNFFKNYIHYITIMYKRILYTILVLSSQYYLSVAENALF